MYNVIIVLDNAKNRSYYYTYVESDGNIVCDDLPPYADINKARACYWDAEDATWIYDEDKYTENMEAQAAELAVAEQTRLETAAMPTNAELAIGLMELGGNVSTLTDAVMELTGRVAVLERR